LTIEDLEREAAEADRRAKAAELSDEEKKFKAALDQRVAAEEAERAAGKARREIDAAERERRAAQAAGGRYIVSAVDVVSLFPPGKAPPMEQLPGKGVVIVRSPSRDRLNRTTADHEAGKPQPETLTELAVDCMIDPDLTAPGVGAHFRAFCEMYGGAAMGIGDAAFKLGGGKAKADKRGGT
jgi:hypothetical protein